MMIALAIFASAALVLSVLGVYGVMAYAVRQRTQEIGVRVALGASRVALVRMIVGESLRIATLGVVAGVAGALVLTGVLRSVVYEVSPADPTTLAMVVVALVASCVLASLLPALRAPRVDPIAALRADERRRRTGISHARRAALPSHGQCRHGLTPGQRPHRAGDLHSVL